MAQGEQFEDEAYFEAVENISRRLTPYQCALMETETRLNILSLQYAADKEGEFNPIDAISCRVKTPKSIAEKLRRRNLPLTFDAARDLLNDIAGARVVCKFVEDIYALKELLLAQDDVELVECKDYIEHPKANGYRSLHLIVRIPVFTPAGNIPVKVEIQMRTIAMHFWANLEHNLNYKADLDEELKESLADELYECAEASAELDRRMGAIRRKIDACQTLLGNADA